MIKDRTSVEAPSIKTRAVTADGQLVIGSANAPLRLQGSEDSIIYNDRIIDVIQMSQEQDTIFTVEQSLATRSTHAREIKLDASIVPAGGLVSISILAPSTGEKDGLGYFLTLYALQPDGTFKCIANSTNKIVQSAFGDWMTYLFIPESTVLTGKVPILLQFRKQEFGVGNNYAMASTGVGVYTACIYESIGGPTSQIMVYDTTTWNDWTPVLKFEVKRAENVIGHSIAIPGLIGTQDTSLSSGSNHLKSIELDTGTIITTKSSTLGFSESDFINNNSKYDNVIPTVKMIRLMLQNQTRLASLPASAAPIIPMPVATMEAVDMDTPVMPAPVMAVSELAQPTFEIATAELKDLEVKPVLTTSKNDRPRKRKKRNQSV